MNKRPNKKQMLIMLYMLLGTGSEKQTQASYERENEPAKQSSESKLTQDQKNQQTVRDIQAKTSSTKAQADALNADVFKKNSTNSPTKSSASTTSSSWNWMTGKADAPAANSNKPAETTGSFDLTSKKTASTKSELTETASTLDERGNKLEDLSAKSKELNNQASDFSKSSKALADSLRAKSMNVKKPSETGPLVDAIDPNGKLTPEQRNKAMEESQAWINPYEGSKFEAWVNSVSEMVMNAFGLKSTAQVEAEAQAQAKSDAAAAKKQAEAKALKEKQTGQIKAADAWHKKNDGKFSFLQEPKTPDVVAGDELIAKSKADAQKTKNMIAKDNNLFAGL